MALRKALFEFRAQRGVVQYGQLLRSRCKSSCGRLGAQRVRQLSGSRDEDGVESRRRNGFFPRRAVMYVPASDERKTKKATTLSVDTLVFDLEDGVATNQKVQFPSSPIPNPVHPCLLAVKLPHNFMCMHCRRKLESLSNRLWSTVVPVASRVPGPSTW